MLFALLYRIARDSTEWSFSGIEIDLVRSRNVMASVFIIQSIWVYVDYEYKKRWYTVIVTKKKKNMTKKKRISIYVQISQKVNESKATYSK